jgi:hypothetical protein
VKFSHLFVQQWRQQAIFITGWIDNIALSDSNARSSYNMWIVHPPAPLALILYLIRYNRRHCLGHLNRFSSYNVICEMIVQSRIVSITNILLTYCKIIFFVCVWVYVLRWIQCFWCYSKVADLIPTVVRLTFQPARCGYTLMQSNIKNIILQNCCTNHPQRNSIEQMSNMISYSAELC